MSEIINTYPLDNPYETLPMNRKDFYAEQAEISKSTWKPTKAVAIVNVFLFNEAGEIILQKRSSSKNHNPNLIDKAVGWHIVHGDEADFTVMVETIQELQVPSLVLKNHVDFQKTFSLLWNYLTTVAIVEKIETRLVQVHKVINNESLLFANKTHLYMWVYEWSVKNVDHEAKGILFYSLEELEDELEKFPDMFTQDLHLYMREYKTRFYEFRDELLNK